MKDEDGGDAALLDVKLLRLLDLLYKTRSVTRTSEQLKQTQSTVSIMLARLRKQFNDPLFVRTTGGMQPTPRADALIATVRAVLEGLRSLSDTETNFDPASSRRVFRIYVPDASHVTLLPRLFAHIHALAPKVRLEAASIEGDIATEMQSGEGDLAIGSSLALAAGFYQQTLFEQDWICLLNAHHPRIREQLTLKDYLAEDHVGILTGSGSRVLNPEVKRQRLERSVLLELPGFLGLPAILSISELIATLPRQIGEALARSAGLRLLACPVKLPSLTIKQHWHARYHHDAANKWLRGICAELFLQPNRRSPGTKH